MNARKVIYPLLLVTGIMVMLLEGNVDEARATGISVAATLPTVEHTVASMVDDGAVALVDSNPIVAAGLLPGGLVTSTGEFTPADPYFDKQWALNRIQQSELWPVTTGDRRILVAVLDTGIDKDHEDLAGQVVAEINLTDSSTTGDIYGHGTPIAGIIAAVSDNGIGIAGMAPDSGLLNVKVAEDYGRCRPAVLARGITWAVDNGASIINISIQLNDSSAELEDAVDYAWDHGVLIIAAAGNNGSQEPVYPACLEHCIAVAATDAEDGLALLSNYGNWVDVAAPGYQIYSTMPDNSYGYKSGTSFATAYVSGLAALLYDIVIDANDNGRLNDDVRMAIELGCRQVDIEGIGSGRIDSGSYVTG